MPVCRNPRAFPVSIEATSSVQDLFDEPNPQFSEAELARMAHEHFGATGGVRLYPSERDQNARCDVADGRSILVKVSHRAERAETIALQNALLEHVRRVDPGLCVPRVVAARGGDHMITISTGQGREHLVRALSWLPGVPLAKVEATPAVLHALGATLGRLSLALRGFFHPAAWRPDFLWNLDNAAAALAWVGEIADDASRAIVQDLIATRFAELPRRLAPLRQAVLYQDANDYNVLVEAGQVSGLIDFGDMSYGRQINELAIALAYAALDKSDPLEAMVLVTRGYASAFTLEPAEVAVLFDLVLLRLAQSLCISSHRARETEDNAYLAISQAPVQRLLAALCQLDHATVSAQLTEAAGLPATPAWELDPQAWEPETLLRRRKDRIAPSLSVAYSQPLSIVRGKGAWLYDHHGRGYLDMVNNVAHVGHCHPHVVDAIARQAALLNTNARYLHKTLLDYADRIVATMPGDLSVCIFTCSGSEANELALRMARAATGRHDALVLDMAYHGHTTALIDISPYKFARKGGAGRKPFVHVAPLPDAYRGKHRGADAGKAYASEVDRLIGQGGLSPAFFIAESLAGVGGQIVPPAGFLQGTYQAVRKAGGVCIADEVQVGFGRVGSHMWAFQAQDVVPDIVTLGKPIGAGHPMAAVVTTPAIAKAFANGMEYFNTFGGNPVSCAAGMAVLDVIEQEGLQENARSTGAYLLEELGALAHRHVLIGDVRGQGLFIGVELVRDRVSLEPARQAAGEVINRMRDKGVLLSTDGPDENVIKIKPPMVFDRANADLFLTAFDEVLGAIAP